ncbi:DNA-binding response regulator, NarL/FixJ family, contains REC and HTH domains [Pseudomonas flavescens]|uniref:DNA-binding response regulator, NarL/FixJ family, contains REC and HTH domains n=1 Tax=Phytopseudomonas flavescens TaxID=29435 RepID=A0A1G7ZMX4_9GAMM|nr:response regulator transcription factor [Pseudomonas flavescens]SDH09985.1 DNA-binding response regulator, NarL/FixJ family, contains REC and HTH domains [Pseudomonas flavescens]
MLDDLYIIADDHPIFRDGLVRLLAQVRPQASLQEAATLDEALTLARLQPPAGILLDLMYSSGPEWASIADWRQEFPDSLLIVVSMCEDPLVIERVMSQGASAFIGKSLPSREIAEALKAALKGERLVRCAPQGGFTSFEPPAAAEYFTALTARQLEVLQLIIEGLSNKEIAQALRISPFTVRIHVSALLSALNVSTRAAAAAVGARHGLGAQNRSAGG